MTTKLKPRMLNDHVLIKPDKREEKTASGIHLPDMAQGEKPERGTVIAVGPGRVTENGALQTTVCREGDTVLFHKNAALAVKHEGEDMLIVRETLHVFAIVDSIHSIQF